MTMSVALRPDASASLATPVALRFQLQLARFSREGNRDVVADHLESHLIDDLGDERVDLARHDARTRLHGGQIDLSDPDRRPAG